MNIGINCYPDSNKFKFRQILASLLVDVDCSGITKNDCDQIISIHEFIINKIKSDDNLFIHILISILNNKTIDFAGLLVTQMHLNNKLIVLIYRYNNMKKFVFSNNIHILLNSLLYFKDLLNFSILTSSSLKIIYKTYIHTKYFKEYNKFDTIQQYIDDMLKKGFKKAKSVNTNEVKVIFLVDGISGYKYKDYQDFMNRFDFSSNNIFKSKPNLKKYFEIEFKNDRRNELNKLMLIINEFKTLYYNVDIIGTKYTNHCTINRNIFMANYNDKPLTFIDDDDISCSLYKKYKYLRQNLEHYKYIPNTEIVNEINKLTGLNLEIVDRKTRYEFVEKVFLWILDKYNHENELISQIMNKLEIIVNEPEYISYTTNLDMKIIKYPISIEGIGFVFKYILPYIIKPFSSIYQNSAEDQLFTMINSGIQALEKKQIYSYIEPSKTCNSDKNSNLTCCTKFYFEMFELNANPFCKYAPDKQNKILNKIYDYDSKIECVFNNEERIEPICKLFKHKYTKL